MSAELLPGVDRVLFTEAQIEERIREVGAEITRDYQGKTVKLVGVLKGSIFFLTALARRIEVPVKIDFLGISSFSNKSGAPGVVRIAKDLDDSIEGDDVMLVEDIVDTGFPTLSATDPRRARAEFALRVHVPGPQLAPHRTGAGALPLFRNSRPLRGRLRPGSQPAIP